MARIGWIVSYPKSGNTWVRLMLESLLCGGAPVDINDIRLHAGIAGRREMDDLLGIESSDLFPPEIKEARPALQQAIAANAEGPLLLRKAHDKYWWTARNTPVFARESSVGAVYLSRDPRDIAVSYAEHRGTSIDSVIAFMADERAELSGAPDRFHDQWPQLLGSWSSHVKSWLDQREVPVQVTRFEDLLRQPAKLLENIAAFLGIAATALEIERAVAATHFEVLRDQEGAAGFVERGLHAKSRFFREGKAEGWRRHLTSAQARQIEEDQSHAMVQLGYL